MNPAENTLMLGLNIVILRARHMNEDTPQCKNNIIMNRLGMQKEIKESAKKCNKTGKDAHAVPFLEFYDGFLLCTSLTTSKELFFHASTLQARDSAHDSLTCAHPSTLEHKIKDKMIEEITCIDSIGDPLMLFKMHSKERNTFIWVVLLLLLISID